MSAAKYVQPADYSEGTSDGVRQLSEMSRISYRQGATGKSIGVVPEEVVFEDVNVAPSLTTSVLQAYSKLMLRNNLSAPIKMEIVASSPAKFKVEPNVLALSAFESGIVKIQLDTKDLAKYLDKQEKQTLREHITLKSDFFTQTVRVTIHLTKAADPNRNNSLMESSLMSSSGLRRSKHGGAPLAGGGMTNALHRMRSLSREIRDSRRSRGSSMQRSAREGSGTREE